MINLLCREAPGEAPGHAPPPGVPDDEDTNELVGEVGGEFADERLDGEPTKPKYVFHERRLYDLYYKTSDSHFKSLMRMLPSTFDCLLDELEPHLTSPGKNY